MFFNSKFKHSNNFIGGNARGIFLKVLFPIMLIIILFSKPDTVNASENKFKYTTLYETGADEESIVFVILGDGFTAGEQDMFEQKAKELMDYLISTEPFNEMQQYMNIYCIDVISNAGGAARNPSAPIDNYFGSTYNYNGIDRLLYPLKADKVLECVKEYNMYCDVPLVLVNDSKYGGSGSGSFAVASVNTDSFEIMIHELGHTIGGLADEYWAGEQYARECANMTKESDASKVPWSDLVGEEDIWVFAYDENPSWHHPSYFCKMRYLGQSIPFCAVCKRQLLSELKKLRGEPADGSKYIQKIYVSSKASKTVRYKSGTLKKAGRSFYISAKARGKVSYKLISGRSSYVSVSRKGKVTLKKGCPAGIYKIRVRAAETDEYSGADLIINIKISNK